MSAGHTSSTTKRKTRQDWIAAARKVLIRSSVDNVKVDRLIRDVQATSGSFYWHFKDREDLLDALLHDWEETNYHAIATVRARWALEARSD